MPLPKVTLTGNLTRDPELRFIPSGSPVVRLSVAANERKFNRDTNQWVDGKTTFLTVEAWGRVAENAAETLRSGMSVTVEGELENDRYEDRDGNRRDSFRVVRASIALDLGRHVAGQVTSPSKRPADTTQRPAEQHQQAPQSSPAQAAPAQQIAAAPSGAGFLSEPPF